MNGAQSLVQTLVNCGVRGLLRRTPARPRCTSSRRSTRCRRCGRCCACSRAWPPAPPTATGAWPTSPRRRCCISGPGLANGLANLHNARRADTPIVNVVGDHATYHLQYDAPLTSDIVGFARPVSSWVHASRRARCTVAGDAARAVQAATRGAGRHRHADPARRHGVERRADRPSPTAARRRPGTGGREAIDDIAGCCATARRRPSCCAARALRGAGLEAAGRVAAKTGARLLCDTFAPHDRTGRRPRGGGAHSLLRRADRRVPDGHRAARAGRAAKPPVSFFAYPGKPSWCAPEGCRLQLPRAADTRTASSALEALADALGAPPPATPRRIPLTLPALPTGALNAHDRSHRSMAHLTPENAIFADESVTSALPLLAPMIRTGTPRTHLCH